MRRVVRFGAASACASALVVMLVTAIPGGAATKPKFTLTSSAFADGATIPVEYTCKGAGTSPPLAWKAVPSKTKQLALIMEDPDTPIGLFVHWVLAGIKPKPPSFAANADPPGSFGGVNGAGRPGWIPPCPPAGPAHHYIFTLFALDKKLTLPPGADAAALRSAMKGRILGRAKLVGLYGTT